MSKFMLSLFNDLQQYIVDSEPDDDICVDGNIFGEFQLRIDVERTIKVINDNGHRVMQLIMYNPYDSMPCIMKSIRLSTNIDEAILEQKNLLENSDEYYKQKYNCEVNSKFVLEFNKLIKEATEEDVIEEWAEYID